MAITVAIDDEIARQIKRNQIISIVLAVIALLNVGLIAAIAGVGGVEGVLIVLAITAIWVAIAYLIYNATVLSSTGSREPNSAEEHRLRPIIDRLSRPLGVSSVQLRVIDDDAANAFAVGTGSKATVVFSTGLLKLLDDEELEGVAAHDLSHIVNGDTKIALYSASFLGWALVVSIVASVITVVIGLWGVGVLTHHDDDDDWASILAKIGVGIGMICVAVAAFIAVQTWFIISRITHMAVFRQREWLADATAVRVTGKPLALARALEKAANFDVALHRGQRLARSLCIFGYDSDNWWDRLFSTHPDIEERIRRLRSYAGMYGNAVTGPQTRR